MHSCRTSAFNDVDNSSNYQRGHGGRRGPQSKRNPERAPKKEFSLITALTKQTKQVVKQVGTWKNPFVNRSKTPPPQRYSNASHSPSVPHSGPVFYSETFYPPQPSSRAPGFKLPLVVYPEDRNQPASSGYGNQTASRGADVYEIRPPPPGSYQDDDTGPSPKNLVTAVMGVKGAVNHFAKALISDMNKHPEQLKQLKQRIRDEVQGDVDRANHWKFLVQAFVCQRMFEGFESKNGFFGLEQFDDVQNSTLASFNDFTRYKDKAVTISELFAKGSEDQSFLGRYCFKKFKSICMDPVTKQSLAIYEKEWRCVEDERHVQSEFYQSFLKVAVSVWLLHLLVHSFEQGWKMLGWETFPKGDRFQKKTMESVVPGAYEEEDEETGTDVSTVVGFLVIPGFQVSRSVVKCEVYVRKNVRKNNVLDGKITEVRSQSNLTDGKITDVRSPSLEKSFSDKTPGNHQTPSSYQTNHQTRSSYQTNYEAPVIYPTVPNYPANYQATGDYRNSSENYQANYQAMGDNRNSSDYLRRPGSYPATGDYRAPSGYPMSWSNPTTGNFVTPPPKSSTDRSPGIRDSRRLSSNQGGHLGRPLAEDVDKSSLFWTRHSIHHRSGGSKSGELDSKGRSQTSSHHLSLPTHPVKSTKASRLLSEANRSSAAKLKHQNEWSNEWN